MSEEILYNQNNNNFDEKSSSIGSADVLKRAMTVTKMDEMLECIKDLKFYAKTVEKDLPDYLETIGLDRKHEMNPTELHTEDFIQLARERSNDDRYILLRDFIRPTKKSSEPPVRSSIKHPQTKSSLDKQINYMRRVIAAQPTALEAIYLEALLNPDQWQYYHQHLLQTSPSDHLTANERQRLNELLYKFH